MRPDFRAPLVPMFLLLAGWLVGATALRASQPPAASASSDTVAKARASLQAGRSGDAVALADTVLASKPADDGAMSVKVDALLAADARDKALDAYDTWFAAARREQLPVAARIARAELEALSTRNVAAIETEALAALAAHGTPAARARLDKAAWAAPPTTSSWPAVIALARLGDTRAAARVLLAARESTGSGRAEAIRAIALARVAGAEAILRETLAMRDPMLQSAAAEAVAALHLESLVPDVQKVALGGEQFARFVAAIALADLHASGGEDLVTAALTGPAADMRLKAAGAMRSRGAKDWAEHVRPLLADPDGLTRFEAAEMLLPVDRQAALKILTPATIDPNFAVRGEVARILTSDAGTDVAELRRLLRDGAPGVRLLAARALVERDASLATPGTRPAPGRPAIER